MPVNRSIEVFTSLARTGSENSPDRMNYDGSGLHLVIDVTAIVATPSVVPTIQGRDSVSGKYYDLLVGLAITATGVTVLKIHPGIVAVANAAANDLLPLIWRLQMVHDDADSITYSVGATVIV